MISLKRKETEKRDRTHLSSLKWKHPYGRRRKQRTGRLDKTRTGSNRTERSVVKNTTMLLSVCTISCFITGVKVKSCLK